MRSRHVINALTAIANGANVTDSKRIFGTVIMSVIAILYTVVLMKTLPQSDT